MALDRSYYVEAPFDRREIPSAGYDYRVWTDHDPGERRTYPRLTVDEQALICEYFDRFMSRRQGEPWGEWTSTDSGLVVPAEEVDAKVLSGYMGDRLMSEAPVRKKRPTLEYLQKLGASADGINRWHDRGSFAVLESDPMRHIGFDYANQMDLLLITYRHDPTLLDPMGYGHDFVPVIDEITMSFSHSSHSKLISMLMAYAYRLGLSEEVQADIFIEQAVLAFGGLKPSEFGNMDTRSQARIAQSDRSIRGYDGLLDWPLACDPGSNYATGLRKVGEMLEFYTCNIADPGDQLKDQTIKLEPKDLPILVRLIYGNARGEPVGEISDLIIERFNIDK